jgi:hypothetical protein
MTVWSNGTNFRTQNDHLIGTVVGNVTGDVTGNVTGNTNGVVTAAAGSTAVTATFGDNDTSLATTAFVQAALQALHPVGSIYINAAVSTNPGTLLGFGTWVAFGAGRVMVGLDAGDPLFDTLQETGGSKDAIVVSHSHSFSGTTSTTGNHQHPTGSSGAGLPNGADLSSVGYGMGNLTGAAGAHEHTYSGTTASTGSSGTNANIQPYITVAVWRRTA